MNQLLIIVDVQNGFVVNQATEAIIPRINKLIKKWKTTDQPVVFSRFINRRDSPWARFMDWSKMMSSPSIDLHSKLTQDYGETYDKTLYSAWSDEIAQICHATNTKEVVICGIDTDQCVLATALGVFEAGLRPFIVADCCATSAEEKFHDAGLMLLKRLIGEKQVILSSDL